MQYPCYSRERLLVVVDLKRRYRNGQNEQSYYMLSIILDRRFIKYFNEIVYLIRHFCRLCQKSCNHYKNVWFWIIFLFSYSLDPEMVLSSTTEPSPDANLLSSIGYQLKLSIGYQPSNNWKLAADLLAMMGITQTR